MKENIVLIGMSWSWKSTLGKIIAEEMGKNFIDFDDYLEEKHKKTVSSILEELWDEKFITMERLDYQDIILDNTVFAPSGSLALQTDIMENINKNAIIIYLNTDVSVINWRKKDMQVGRIVWYNGHNLDEIYAKRKAIYESIFDIEVKTIQENTKDENAWKIIEKIELYETTFKNIKDTYSLHALTFKKQTELKEEVKNLYSLFCQYIPHGKILDIGCGYGRDIKYFKEKGYDVIGIDLSEKMKEIAYPEVKDCIFIGNAFESQKYFQKESFDWIWTLATIVHMEKEMWEKLLEKMIFLLKVWGSICFSTKLREEWTPEKIKKESISIPWIKNTYTYYTEDELKYFFEKQWLTIRDIIINWDTKQNKDRWINIIASK